LEVSETSIFFYGTGALVGCGVSAGVSVGDGVSVGLGVGDGVMVGVSDGVGVRDGVGVAVKVAAGRSIGPTRPRPSNSRKIHPPSYCWWEGTS